MALFVLLLSGRWRKHVLIGAILVGYLVVLVFSNYAQSERFHLPILPLHLMFAAYGIAVFPGGTLFPSESFAAKTISIPSNLYPYPEDPAV